MTEKAVLTEVTPDAHGQLKIDPNCAVSVAKEQHMINLKVNEAGHASTQFPLFLSRISDGSDWAISAINSFELDKNLFVSGAEWTATYRPLGMLTYPFFLMRKEGTEKDYCVGIQEGNSAFSDTDGEPMFESDGKAGIMLSRATALLEQELNNEIHTYQFTKLLEEFDLVKPIDIQVHYREGRVNTLKGLYTIDEVKLQELEEDKLLELRKRGYLLPAYAMLTSIYQLNALLKKHNEVYGEVNWVSQVKLELPKEEAAA